MSFLALHLQIHTLLLNKGHEITCLLKQSLKRTLSQKEKDAQCKIYTLKLN